MRVAYGVSFLAAVALTAGPTGCASDDAGGPDDSADFAGDGGGKADDGIELPSGATYRLQIEHGAYPAVGDRPNVIAYVPHGFDDTAPLDIVVFLHGWYNCIDNVVRPANGRCSTGGAIRQAYNLAGQLEASHKNALLVVPELRFEMPSGDPGALAGDGAFAALIDDTLAALAPQLGDRRGQIGHIIVASHSGGYQSTAAIASRGGMPVDEIWLLDSLYGQIADYDAWVSSPDHGAELTAAPFTMRFASIYTTSGGTLGNSQAMARRATGWFGATVLDDRTTATLTADDYAHGLIYKHTGLVHDDVPRYYFGKLLASSLLSDKPAEAAPSPQ